MAWQMPLSPAIRRTAVAAGAGVGTAGVLAGVLFLGPKATSVLLFVVFILVWPLAAAVRHVSDDPPYESPIWVAAGVAGAVVCVPGLFRLLAWGAGGLLAAAAAAGLFVLIDLVFSGGRSRRRRSSPYGELTRLSRTGLRTDGNGGCPLSTEELCGVWCETSTALQDGTRLGDRQTVAEVRRICLDEFERRNPDGFQRWIEAGAPANPDRFLLPEAGE
jgi:hypothetical protein